MISRVISGHTQQDTLVMHLGTTDIEQYDVGSLPNVQTSSRQN